MENPTKSPLNTFLKLLFRLVWIATPIPFVLIYRQEWWFADPSSFTSELSTIVGVSAFIWFSGQLVLAARPFGLARWFGVPQLLNLHALMAVFGFAAVQAHFFLKSSAPDFAPSFQTMFGFIANLIILLGSIFAYLSMSNAPGTKAAWLQRIRKTIKEKWQLSYPRLRLIHNLLALAVLLAMVHVLLATNTQYTQYASIAMASWLGVGVLLLVIYRIRKRAN